MYVIYYKIIEGQNVIESPAIGNIISCQFHKCFNKETRDPTGHKYQTTLKALTFNSIRLSAQGMS
jgi:hypothetical protein